ncbi:MAG: FAD-dependent oxidoreductase [Comamonas sp.]
MVTMDTANSTPNLNPQTPVWDFIVIGAGMAGSTTAWQLADSATVLVLERESQPGYHTTGRSAALFEEHYGPAQVQALTRASRAFYEQPPSDFADHAIVSPRGVLYVATADQLPQLQTTYQEALQHSPGARWLDAGALQTLLPALNTELLIAGFMDDGARDIDVHSLHQGFLRGLRQRGGQLWTDADVAALQWDAATQLWNVRLQDGRSAQARHIVNAAGAWADVMGQLAGASPIGLTPKRRSAFTFAVPAGMDGHTWPAVIDVDEQWYFKPDAGQLLGSPANADATTPHDVQPEELDIAIGIDRIMQVTHFDIRRPQHTWAGLRSFVADGEMVIGWDTSAPQFLWVAAQGGYGIQSAYGYGLLARNLALHEPLDAQLLAQGVQVNALSPKRLGV